MSVPPDEPMLADAVQATVRRLAQESGFANAGMAAVPKAADRDALRAYLEAWVERGAAGEMEYLKRRNEGGELVRSSLTAAAPWARSVIVCAAPYGAEAPLSIEKASNGSGWIARYAWSGVRDANGGLRPADYHKVLLARLKQLEAKLGAVFGSFRSWAYVDTGPVIERDWAARAGVGWTGKNTCTLDEQLGSFFFLGVILTSLELPAEAQATLPADRCGSCTRCIDACPTNALTEPYQMDASRCIAYLTIEKRGPIPHEFRAGMGRQVFGCDICQDVCPWNGKAIRVAAAVGASLSDPAMEARPELVNPPLAWLAQLTEGEFGQLFFGSPVKRAKYPGLRRNVAIAMGNSGDPAFLPQLEAWVRDPDAVLADAARWSILRLQDGRGNLPALLLEGD